MSNQTENLFFSSLEELEDTLIFKTSSINQVDIPDEVKIWRKKASEIQARFDFTIPNYILDEIIEQEDSIYRENLYYLINCAVLNDRLSLENAKKIREVY